ncbi:MAG: pantoate--beta-alanine ligase [Planctomycetota bacterium]
MKSFRSIRELRIALAGAPRPLGFVPTMGALHEGHAHLVRKCREECSTVVASVFVNPAQFGEGEDLGRYPRDLKGDSALLDSLGTDLLFAPGAEEIYPEGFAARVDPGPLAAVYEGAERPGHFAGVCTVVLKLFHIVGPDRAYFGRKDAQQLVVLETMVRDLDLDLTVVAVETVRDPDGLALSSRNAYLEPAQRELALGLSRGLAAAAKLWDEGERDRARLEAAARAPGLEYDYCAGVDPVDFGEPRPGGPVLLIAAIRVGGTRLIDNALLGARI